MKTFRPYHFPPLAQRAAPAGVSVSAGDGAATAAQWQDSVADGFQQGQRDGYDAGLARGREDGIEAGRAEGLALGRAEGRAQAVADFDQLARPLDAMLKSLKKLRTDYQAAQRTEVVDLVAKVARQVIRAELALQPVQLLALVDEALASMPATREQIEVALNPEELTRVTELDPKRAKRWNLLADPALEPGECRVKAGDHEVDAGCLGRLAACMDQVSAGLQLAAEEVAA